MNLKRHGYKQTTDKQEYKKHINIDTEPVDPYSSSPPKNWGNLGASYRKETLLNILSNFVI